MSKSATYARIFVHEDVVTAVSEAITSFQKDLNLPYEDPRLAAMRDLIDPLPEKDIHGHTPFLEYIELSSTLT